MTKEEAIEKSKECGVEYCVRYYIEDIGFNPDEACWKCGII